MIRFLFRSIGFLALAAAFCLLIIDGVRSIADTKLRISDVQSIWNDVNAASLQSLKPLVIGKIGAFAWDPIFTGFLSAPSWAVLGFLGIVLILLGRKKKPLIGYAR